jgi:hypothetical protein
MIESPFFETIDKIQDVITIIAIPLFTVIIILILIKINKIKSMLK